MTQRRITLLAGGVGGAKAAEGLMHSRYGQHATVIGNTGDDDRFHGLWVSPDLDTLVYSLADHIDRQRGWGRQHESYQTLNELKAYGENSWMTLGDLDFATHIYRTNQLNQGKSLTQVTRSICRRFGISMPVLPATNDVVQTRIRFNNQWHSFQEYFVQHRCQPEIEAIDYQGIRQARITPEAEAAISRSDIILLAPSNPVVSLNVILAIPGVMDAIRNSQAYVLAISPFISGKTVKGPADKMMHLLDASSDSQGVASVYQGLIDGLVIDKQDKDDALALRQQGLDVCVMPTLMSSLDDKIRVIEDALDSALAWSTQKEAC